MADIRVRAPCVPYDGRLRRGMMVRFVDPSYSAILEGRIAATVETNSWDRRAWLIDPNTVRLRDGQPVEVPPTGFLARRHDIFHPIEERALREREVLRTVSVES